MSDIIESELKPCPFCGGEVGIFDLAGWEIICDCGLLFATVKGDRDGVTKKWNTRTPSIESIVAVVEDIQPNNDGEDSYQRRIIAAIRAMDK